MSVRITWWGHATCTVELGGVRVLTDPVLTHRVAHLSRPGRADPPPDAARADVVVVSHLHADHLHLPSLRRLDPATRLVVPVGASAVLRGQVPATTIDEVGAHTAAGTTCGSCHDTLDDLISARCGSCPLVGLAVA